MLWTFVGEPAFSKHVHQFHRALTKHYSQGGKHLYDPAEMEAFCDHHAPGLFGQLYKSIVNDEKEKPSEKRLEMQKTRVVSMLHNLSFFHNQVQVTYIKLCVFCSYGKLQCCCHLFLFQFNLALIKVQSLDLLKSKIESTSCTISTLVQTKCLLGILSQIFQWRKTVMLKELAKLFFFSCVC